MDNSIVNPDNLPFGDGTYVIDPNNVAGRVRETEPGKYAVDFLHKKAADITRHKAMVDDADAMPADEILAMMGRVDYKIVTEDDALNAVPDYDALAEQVEWAMRVNAIRQMLGL